MTEIPVIILGSGGYVAGEVLRLLALHPVLRLRAAVSRSQVGQLIVDTFPHLRGPYGDETFVSLDDARPALGGDGVVAVFSCLPHGEAARLLDELMTESEASGSTLRVVDLSADFRLPDAVGWEAVYGEEHGAPTRCSSFSCGLPELRDGEPQGAIAHPGCFTTAVTLGSAGLVGQGLIDGPLRVSAVTGSTGSGARPSATTHHPVRHGNLKAYKALGHRHAPEMRMLLERLGDGAVDVRFAPHSGPFARGIHATIHADLREAMTTEELTSRIASFYSAAPFVTVSSTPPTLKEVVGTNRCHIGVAAEGRSAVVFSVIDNLVKGAAGGAVQWMNLLCGLDETTGLMTPGLGWS